MCFSASASFTASAVLATIGVISVKKSKTASQRLLSLIPLFFCIQQFAEGLLWLGLSHQEFDFLKQFATYVFLVFAQVIWPIMIPYCMMKMEKQPQRKKILTLLLGSGIVVSLYLAYCLSFYPIIANIDCYHIHYEQYFPILPVKYGGLFYLIPTVISPIISTNKRLQLLGLILLVSYIVTSIFYKYYLTSVWCYFAAIISLIILSIIMDMNKQREKIVVEE